MLSSMAVAVAGRGLASSPSTSPLGADLDHIPLNFPLGCGPGPDPPQLSPWLWAWSITPGPGIPLD